jgi:hypothetical protein
MEWTPRDDSYKRMKQLLAAQIKLDIATTIRHHPHLDGADAARAYEALASEESVDKLVADLARESIQEALAKGEPPPASWLHLAGYKLNRQTEN